MCSAIARAYRANVFMRCNDSPELLTHLFNSTAAAWRRDVPPSEISDNLIFSGPPEVILAPQCREALDDACLVGWEDGAYVTRSTQKAIYGLLKQQPRPAAEVLQELGVVCKVFADYEGFEVAVEGEGDVTTVLLALQAGIKEFDEIEIAPHA